MSDDDAEDVFLDVDDGVLNENDHWKDVCAAVSSVSPTSRELAKNLGLKSEDISSIFANFQLSDKDRLSEVIKYWLQWNFNVKKEGKPSWQTLAKAVHPIKPILAESIAQKHKARGGKQSCNTDERRKRGRPVNIPPKEESRLTLDKDMRIVIDKVWKIRHKFHNLGMNLGIDAGTLDVANRKGDDGEALNSIIKTWLRKSDPKPTWRALIKALRKGSVQEEALADEIAKEYCPDELTSGEAEDDEVDTEPKPKKYQRLSREGVNEPDTIQQEYVSGGNGADSEAKTADNTSTEKDVQSWSVEQVVKYFESTSNCKPFAKFCQDQEIDGDSLLSLSEDFLKKYEVKAGLAVKVMRHVEKLKSSGTVIVII